MSKVPGVIIKSKFKLPQATRRARRYTTYLNYIDRPETKARSHQFENYHDYMEDELKSSGLFTATQDRLSATEREQLREVFRRAQENGSILWQDVISFDEAWLQEVGVKENRYIDEQRLMQATRNATTFDDRKGTDVARDMDRSDPLQHGQHPCPCRDSRDDTSTRTRQTETKNDREDEGTSRPYACRPDT